ncbi:hypothetical protein CHU98_g4797 [Xylaria longipes]|nr:hypothetical protein CHU98_g4797 [Xylaria longipes]
MNLSPYEMEGSSQTFYELESGNQPNNYNMNDPNEILLSFGNQSVPSGSPHWSQGPELGPSCYPNGETSNAPNSSCRFRPDVLDDYAQACFYARLLEIYLVDGEDANLSCPFVDCAAGNFSNTKAMLRHLSGHHERFKVRSSNRCRWDKEHLKQKLQKFFRGFTGNRPETKKSVKAGLCCQCKAPIDKISTQGADHATQFMGGYPMQSTTPEIIPNHMQFDMPNGQTFELDTACLSELSAYTSDTSKAGNLSSENSPIHPQPLPEYNHSYPVSEVSSATLSPDGSKANTNISPGSSIHEQGSIAARRPNSENILKRVTRRSTEFRSEASPSNGIVDQRCASLYSNLQTNHVLGSFNTMSAGTFVGPANIPPTSTLHLSSRDVPKLRVETSPEIPCFTMPTPEFQVPLQRSQIDDYPAMTEVRTATSLPTSIMHSQTSAVSLLETLSPEDDFFMQQLSAVIDASSSASPFPMPHPQQTSPSSSTSESELRCLECDFIPTGKPEGLKAYLRKHMNNMHGERSSIQCSHCSREFTRSDNLAAHCRREHITSSTSPSKRRRGSSDGLPSPSQPKRRGAVRGRKTCE